MRLPPFSPILKEKRGFGGEFEEGETVLGEEVVLFFMDDGGVGRMVMRMSGRIEMRDRICLVR
jgi:hypothetical protein